MKRNKLALIALLAALSSFGVSSVRALPESQANTIREKVANLPVLELAPTAARIVQQAPAKDREEVAVFVVRTVVTQKRAVARDVVVAIAKVAPEVTPSVAAEAAKLCPDQAVLIAKEAAAFAPAQAREIAASVARVSPGLATDVTKVVVAADPEQAPEIIEAVVVAVPTAKATVESDATLGVVRAVARHTRSNASAFRPRVVSRVPRVVSLPPPTPTVPQVQARSVALVNAINDIRNLEVIVPTVDKSQISSVVVDAVKAFDAVNRNTALSKPEKDAILLATAGTVKTVVADPDLPAAQKAEAAKAGANAIQVIVSDTKLTADVAKTFVEFVTQKVAQLATEPNTKGLALGESIKAVAGEVQQVIKAVQTITPEQARAALAQVEQKVEEVKNKYNAPTP